MAGDRRRKLRPRFQKDGKAIVLGGNGCQPLEQPGRVGLITTLLIYAFPSGAVAFAIGEKNTTNGSTITYRVVPLSNLDSCGGEETSSWKELWQKLAPACGIDWGTITGKASPRVRRPLPDYMGVIVISRAIESASRSTGITAHIVVVRTNTRRPDRGMVEAQIC